MNTLFLRNIQIDSVIGVYDWERTNPQTLLLDLDLSLTDNQAGLTDDLQYTVNYADLVEKLRLVARQSQRHLIEALAEDLSTCILSEFKVKKMRLCLIKQGILPQVGQVGVEIVRPIQE